MFQVSGIHDSSNLLDSHPQRRRTRNAAFAARRISTGAGNGANRYLQKGPLGDVFCLKHEFANWGRCQLGAEIANHLNKSDNLA